MKKVKKNRGITTLKDKYGRMFTTPWLIGIILFYLLPLAQSVVYSFADVKIKLGGMDISLVGLKHTFCKPELHRVAQEHGYILFVFAADNTAFKPGAGADTQSEFPRKTLF